MKTQHSFLLTALLFLFFSSQISCKKDILNKDKNNSLNSNENAFDNSTKIKATFLGQVLDENNLPVANAIVKIGNTYKNTNDEGIFYFRNIITPKHATSIVVEKQNYFDGIKTVMCFENQDVYTKIKLVPRKVSGNFNAKNGGRITLNNAKIDFKPQSIVNDNTKIAYEGNVKVFAHYYNPESEDLEETMPGALRGINTNGTEKLLTTYGMLAVEMEDESGNKLQLAENKKATISLPISSTYKAELHNEIPLWHLDENSGMWIEEGMSKKVGNEYVGEVSHFSYWNVDIPGNYVLFQATFLDQNGFPLINHKTKIKKVSNNSFAFGFTNSGGFVSGMVPDNDNFEFSFYELQCSGSLPAVLFNQLFNTMGSPINWGTTNININNAGGLANITGTLLDCNNTVISNGYITINLAGFNNTIIVQPDINGNFSASLNICSNPSNYIIKGYDNISMTTETYGYSINNGTNNLGNIIACGKLTDYIKYDLTTNGVTSSYEFKKPTSNFNLSYNTTLTRTQINAQFLPNLTTNFSIIGLNNNTSLHTLRNFTKFETNTSVVNKNNSIPKDLQVNISQYGSVGSQVVGDFKGDFISNTNQIHHIKAEFRVTRNF